MLNNIVREVDEETRRPASCIANLRIDHPRIIEFIQSKRKEDFLKWRFNISVEISKNFIDAVSQNAEWNLITS